MRYSYTSNNTYQTHKHWSQCVEPFKHQQIIFQLLIFPRLLYMFTKEGAIPTPSFHLLSPLVCKGISWLRAWLPWLPEADSKKRRAGFSSPSKRRAILFHLLFVVIHSFTADDGRKNPARCAALVAQLRQDQDHVQRLIQSMMDEVIPELRASRDFRVKYPEDLISK